MNSGSLSDVIVLNICPTKMLQLNKLFWIIGHIQLLIKMLLFGLLAFLLFSSNQNMAR